MVFAASPTRGFHFDELEQMLPASGVAKRLLVACAPGSVSGILLAETERDSIAPIQRVSRLLTFRDLEDA